MQTNHPAEGRNGAPSVLVTQLVIALLCLLWGSTWLVIKEGLRDLPPLTSVAIRFTLAALAFAVLVPLLATREGGRGPSFWLSLVMGLFTFSISYGIVYWCETVIPSSLASVLFAVFPMLMAGSGHLFLTGERLAARNWLGFAIGFLGVVVLFLTDLRDLGPEAVFYGAIFMISPLASVVGNTAAKRWGRDVSSLKLNRDGMFLGAVFLWLSAFAFERGAELRWTPRAIFSVAYLTVMGTVVTFGLYYWLLRYASAGKLSLITYVIPIVALILGALVGHESVGTMTVVGTAMILGGVTLAART